MAESGEVIFKQLLRVDGKVVRNNGAFLCEVYLDGKEEIISMTREILREYGLLDEADDEEDGQENSPQSPGGKREEWSDSSAKLLISLYGPIFQKLHDQKRFSKKRLWEELSKQMATFGHTFDETHIRNKWTTMGRNFKATIESNSCTGRGRKSRAYFSELSELHCKSTSMVPEVVLGTGRAVPRSELLARAGMSAPVASTSRSPPVAEEDSDDTEDSSNVSGASSEATPAKRGRPRGVLAEIQTLSTEMLRRSEQREERRRKEAERKQESVKKLQESIEERNKLLKEKNELTKKWLEFQMRSL